MQNTFSDMTQGEQLISELKKHGMLGDLTYAEIQAIKTYDSPDELKTALARFTPAAGAEPQSVADWVATLSMTPEQRWDAGRSNRFPWDYLVLGLAGAAFLSLALVVWLGSIGWVVAGTLWVALAIVETASGCAFVPFRSLEWSRAFAWRDVDPFGYWLNLVLRWGLIIAVAVAFVF